MKTVEQFTSELTNEQLKVAFEEIKHWRETGILTEGVIRKVHSEFTSQEAASYPIYSMENPILFEIAKRSFEK